MLAIGLMHACLRVKKLHYVVVVRTPSLLLLSDCILHLLLAVSIGFALTIDFNGHTICFRSVQNL